MPDPSPPRPRCSVFIAVSVDGYIARADGSIDWLEAVQRPGLDYGYQAFFDAIDTLVIGRATYDLARGFAPWPYAGKRCVVLTHRPIDARHGEQALAGGPDAVVATLAAAGARRVYVDGGTVIQQFLRAGLVDDLTLSVVPVVLGGGLPLFAPGGPETRLTLDEARSWPTGLTQLRYRTGPL